MHREHVELVRTRQAISDSIQPVDHLPNLSNAELGDDATDSGSRLSRSVAAMMRATTTAAKSGESCAMKDWTAARSPRARRVQETLLTKQTAS
jgi:hypothetical protein